MNNARDYHEYRHKWGKIGSSYLFYEDGGLSFLLYFSKQFLVGNIHRNIFKISSVIFTSEESP